MPIEGGKKGEENTFISSEIEVMNTDLAAETGLSPSELGGDKNQTVKRESTMGNIPLTDTLVLNELVKEDENACFTLTMIAAIRQSIEVFSKKESFSDDDAKVLQDKQLQLMQKLTEFDEITRRVHQLIEMSSSSLFPKSIVEVLGGTTPSRSSGLSSEHELDKGNTVTPEEFHNVKEYQDRAMQTGESSAHDLCIDESPSDDRLDTIPVVVCGLKDYVLPGIIVCESPKRKKDKIHSKC